MTNKPEYSEPSNLDDIHSTLERISDQLDDIKECLYTAGVASVALALFLFWKFM